MKNKIIVTTMRRVAIKDEIKEKVLVTPKDWKLTLSDRQILQEFRTTSANGISKRKVLPYFKSLDLDTELVLLFPILVRIKYKPIDSKRGTKSIKFTLERKFDWMFKAE